MAGADVTGTDLNSTPREPSPSLAKVLIPRVDLRLVPLQKVCNAYLRFHLDGHHDVHCIDLVDRNALLARPQEVVAEAHRHFLEFAGDRYPCKPGFCVAQVDFDATAWAWTTDGYALPGQLLRTQLGGLAAKALSTSGRRWTRFRMLSVFTIRSEGDCVLARLQVYGLSRPMLPGEKYHWALLEEVPVP